MSDFISILYGFDFPLMICYKLGLKPCTLQLENQEKLAIVKQGVNLGPLLQKEKNINKSICHKSKCPV